MAKYLAIEWDGQEARIAVGRARGRELTVEQAFGFSIASSDPNVPLAEGQLAERIAAELQRLQLGRADALVAVGRSNVELRTLTLPVVPEEELPDIVRFQAMKSFANIGDDWPLDFTPLKGDGEQVSILASAISPKLVAAMQQTCGACDLTPARLVLRPFSAASLMRRLGALPAGMCSLLVDLLADEADLTVVDDGEVAFLRTVRIPSGTEEAVSRALYSEIRRTIAAAQSQLRGRRVEQITVCGAESEHGPLAQMLRERLDLQVDLLNPFDRVDCVSGMQSPTHPGRFAPLLGMLADEIDGTPPGIDFLHPRKRPEPPSKAGRNTLAVTAVAALVAAIVILIGGIVYRRNQEIASLTTQVNQLRQLNTKQSEPVMKRLESLETFQSTDINWADELYRISEKYPNPDDATVRSIRLRALQQDAARVLLSVRVRDPEVIAPLEEALRDQRHDVRGDGAKYNRDASPTHPYEFVQTITVTKAKDDAEAAAPTEGGATEGAATPDGGAAEEPQAPAASATQASNNPPADRATLNSNAAGSQPNS